MKISDLTRELELFAPPVLQEPYDNAGLLTGDSFDECTGVMVTLDVTEPVIREAVEKNCNLVVAHHPIIFKGLKKINANEYVGATVISAIKNDVAIYAAHTNLDNILHGVNAAIASKLSLQQCRILLPATGHLAKLFTFVPAQHLEKVRDALFNAGGGVIGNYSECSFSSEGTGTFRPGTGARPFSGELNKRTYENEVRLEIQFPGWLQQEMLSALRASHPYEEIAFEIILTANRNPAVGSGLVGELEKSCTETEFLATLQSAFRTKAIRHSPLSGRKIKKVALCGGAGSFLISKALQSSADVFVTADLKYHEFFEAHGRMLLADIGHFESEQFTIDLLAEFLQQKFPNFAVLKSEIITNPVHYFL